jgi:uncharacterized membrane protein YedE/YeeE
MKNGVTGFGFGVAFGCVAAWAHLSHSEVIRDMLMLRDAHVLLVMGASLVVAAIGVRLLRAMKVRAALSGEVIGWDPVRPELRHVTGSILFGIGWSVAGTCPGPAAVAIGEGRLSGLVIVAGLFLGVLAEGARAKRVPAGPVMEPARAAGL